MTPEECRQPGLAVDHEDGFSGILTGDNWHREPELFVVIKTDGTKYGAYPKYLRIITPLFSFTGCIIISSSSSEKWKRC